MNRRKSKRILIDPGFGVDIWMFDEIVCESLQVYDLSKHGIRFEKPNLIQISKGQEFNLIFHIGKEVYFKLRSAVNRFDEDSIVCEFANDPVSLKWVENLCHSLTILKGQIEFPFTFHASR